MAEGEYIRLHKELASRAEQTRTTLDGILPACQKIAAKSYFADVVHTRTATEQHRRHAMQQHHRPGR